MSVVLRLDRLTKDFSAGLFGRRKQRALDEVSFELSRGEVFGLLGPNGAGKTTTLKLITGLLRPTSGHVTVFGGAPGDRAARAALGFLPEHPVFYDHLTAEELLAYFAGLCGISGADRTRRVSQVLDDVGLGDARRRPMRQYSKGMLQRVGLAQALINEPALVILDEPMSGLDPIGRREVRELILKLRDGSRTVLFSSHILSDAETLCSRVAILARGRLMASGAVGDLTAGKAGGWEVIAANLSPAAVAALQARTTRATRIAHGRYTFELAEGERPEPFIAALTELGGALVSASPTRATLEDVFVEQVS
ncbi:MAG TPA: ABC transporter ATP-binding protein [Vicinamibacterales bacterium]|nr:ABC transporter ATP-binding protein [Vicinamibacterales bacterium]